MIIDLSSLFSVSSIISIREGLIINHCCSDRNQTEKIGDCRGRIINSLPNWETEIIKPALKRINLIMVYDYYINIDYY